MESMCVCVATSEGWFLEVFFNALAMVEVSAIYPVHILRMILIINNSLQITHTKWYCQSQMAR